MLHLTASAKGEEEFKTVGRKGGRRRAKGTGTTSVEQLQRAALVRALTSDAHEEQDPAVICAKLREARSTLSSSRTTQAILGCVSTATHSEQVQHMVCYGVGNFGSKPVATHQMGLALLLHELLEVPSALEVFDPVLSTIEIGVAQQLGCSIISRNEEGRRAISERTLFYMPHCGRRMYVNLVGANWSKHALANLIVIGNSFRSYAERASGAHSAMETVCRVCDEAMVEDGYIVQGAFNDHSIHTFPAHKLESAAPDLWNCIPKEENPSGFDPEVISADLELCARAPTISS